ncbi:MAG: hypothetical protein PHG66_00995 [Candidatus Colwellbacteria bacterium]|nr:hypothetical protein [Candidatus Colwellbacteria bacterium]
MSKTEVEIIFEDHIFVAVIGTAGGKKDPMNEKLDEDLFRKMVISADKTIMNEFGLDSRGVILVSGGAAWSDHVAVELYKTGRYGGLQIHFPCEWEGGKHNDTGEYDWRTNPGRLANSLHDAFSKKIGRDSQSDFSLLSEDENVQFVTGKGFHTRNSKVAKSEYMIAFTFGSIKGGTSDTWGKCKGSRHHIDIDSLT